MFKFAAYTVQYISTTSMWELNTKWRRVYSPTCRVQKFRFCRRLRNICKDSQFILSPFITQLLYCMYTTLFNSFCISRRYLTKKYNRSDSVSLLTLLIHWIHVIYICFVSNISPKSKYYKDEQANRRVLFDFKKG